MANNSLFSSQPLLPSQKATEDRFNFVKDDLLRTNIAIAFRYVIYLIIGLNRKELPGAISYSIFKDIILHTAAVVESCIHYVLKTTISKDKIKIEDVMDYQWKEDKCIQLYSAPNGDDICGVIKHKRYDQFNDETQFNDLNKIAKKSKIFNEETFRCAEEIRKARNRIHLAALKEVDDYYQQKDVNRTFDNAKKILDTIELYLSQLGTAHKT